MTEVIKTQRKKQTKSRSIMSLTDQHQATIEDNLSPKQIRSKIKKIQTDNATIDQEYDPNFVWEEYQNMRSMRKIPINNIWIDALAKEMTKWIDDNTDAIRFDEFLQKKAMLEMEFRRLMAKSAVLKRAFDYCIKGIARNREIGAWKRGKSWQVASYNLAYYCDITKGESERRAKLRDDLNVDGGTKIVVIPSVEEFEKEMAKKKEQE